jgi:hypothetical protein
MIFQRLKTISIKNFRSDVWLLKLDNGGMRGQRVQKFRWSVEVVIRARFKDGANDELQGLALKDNDRKPRRGLVR